MTHAKEEFSRYDRGQYDQASCIQSDSQKDSDSRDTPDFLKHLKNDSDNHTYHSEICFCEVCAVGGARVPQSVCSLGCIMCKTLLLHYKVQCEFDTALRTVDITVTIKWCPVAHRVFICSLLSVWPVDWIDPKNMLFRS